MDIIDIQNMTGEKLADAFMNVCRYGNLIEDDEENDVVLYQQLRIEIINRCSR